MSPLTGLRLLFASALLLAGPIRPCAGGGDTTPAAFLTLRVNDSKLVIDRFTVGDGGDIALARSRTVGFGRVSAGSVPIQATPALLSPNGHWLAVELSYPYYLEGGAFRDDMAVVVVDVQRHRRVYQENWTKTHLTGVDRWLDADTLLIRRVRETADGTPTGEDAVQIHAPGWKPRKVGDAEDPEKLAKANTSVVQTREAAARILTDRDYVMSYRISLPAGPEDRSWHTPRKLAGLTGAVSSDGNTVATLISEKPGHRDVLFREFIVLKRSDGWAEHILPITDRIEAVQFWRDYLVVTTSRNNLPDRFVTLWRLADLSMALEVPADSFVPE